MEIGHLIAKARAQKSLSQRKLASLLNVGPSAVAQWELGSTHPTNENMAALRAILEIQVAISDRPTAPYSGQIVDDPDELALLRFWRGLSIGEREFMLRRLMLNPPPREPSK